VQQLKGCTGIDNYRILPIATQTHVTPLTECGAQSFATCQHESAHLIKWSG
jgi:hypothetical protein